MSNSSLHDGQRFFIADLCVLLEIYLAPEQVSAVYRAYLFSAEAHEGQCRLSGEPYIYHPLAVARVLAELRADAATLKAALLHDVIEDTTVSKERLVNEFGEEVAELVDGVSKLNHIGFESKAEAQAASFRKMVMAMAKDLRVILIKLADRLHNMRTLLAKSPAAQRRIAKETLEVYALIAHRLGIGHMAQELEELSFAALYPLRYKILSQRVQKICGHQRRRDFLSTLTTSIGQRLAQEGIQAEVSHRKKHLYSIYKKMLEKKIGFERIMDLVGVRIIVGSEDHCYRALGLVHSLYQPKPGSFKDYIAIPKANGYQSLHTVLFGPHGMPLEIQIRTRDMHDCAEYGIAAHHLYKNQENNSGLRRRTNEWLRRLLDLQNNAVNATDFLEHVKVDLFPDEIYVFTPKGKIAELPGGATAVDFAYAVHSEVGNSTVAARVDGKLVPLSTPLASGQTVEIITISGATPRLEWLNFVVTAKARSSIRSYLKHQHQDESVRLGKTMLDVELERYGLSVDGLSKSQLNALLSTFNCKTLECVLEDIGTGHRLAFVVAHQLAPQENGQICETLAQNPSKPLLIKGTEGMLVSLAKCCRPLPGDRIKGYVSAGKGIVVHTEQCKNVAEYRERTANWLNLNWAKILEAEFPASLRVEADNQRGVLAIISSALARLEINIEEIASEEKDAYSTTLRLGIMVRDRNHLAAVIRHLRRIRCVKQVQRA